MQPEIRDNACHVAKERAMSAQATPRKLIRLPVVLDRVGLKRSAIYKRIKANAFPKPR